MRNHTILLCKLIWLAVTVMVLHVARAAEPAAKTEQVRKVAVTLDPLKAATFSAKPGVTRYEGAKELKPLGDDVAKQVEGKIDFAKEDLVHVAWGSGGPPFGELVYETKKGSDGPNITFYVKEPKAAIRGEAFRMGNDFFAVPKKAAVKFRK